MLPTLEACAHNLGAGKTSARALVEQRYDWTRLAPGLLALYARLGSERHDLTVGG